MFELRAGQLTIQIDRKGDIGFISSTGGKSAGTESHHAPLIRLVVDKELLVPVQASFDAHVGHISLRYANGMEAVVQAVSREGYPVLELTAVNHGRDDG